MKNLRNIWIVFKREYISRVKNKTFIIMTFLAPVLIVGFYALSIFIATRDEGGSEQRIMMVSDQSKSLTLGKVANYNLVGSEIKINSEYTAAQERIDSAANYVKQGMVDAWLLIEDKDLNSLDSATLYASETPSLVSMEAINNFIKQQAKNGNMRKMGIRQSAIDSLEAHGSIALKEIGSSGEIETSSSGLKSGVGFMLAFMIYMFIFVYGASVMRGALEEKTNRIVEVIVSSVKPFHLMMGKIVGIAAVGLTQFLAWIILVLVLGTAGGVMMGKSQLTHMASKAPTAMSMDSSFAAIQGDAGNGGSGEISTASPVANMVEAGGLLEAFQSMPILNILLIFVLFFVGGYLLYASMFAAIGAAVNQETETQQFMMPITLPLVLGFVIAQTVALKAPNGSTAQLFSMIPFTSPIVMVVRAPFGVPISEILLSFGILTVTFIGMVWLTSKIYRIGILSYGKKPSWKDLWRWLRF